MSRLSSNRIFRYRKQRPSHASQCPATHSTIFKRALCASFCDIRHEQFLLLKFHLRVKEFSLAIDIEVTPNLASGAGRSEQRTYFPFVKQNDCPFRESGLDLLHLLDGGASRFPYLLRVRNHSSVIGIWLVSTQWKKTSKSLEGVQSSRHCHV